MRSGFDGDALDLEALADVDGAVVPPGPMAGDMLLRLRPILPAQSRHDARDFGGRVGVGDQHGVVGRDHDHIVETDGGDQRAFTPDVGVVHVFGEDVALQHVAVAIGLTDAVQGRPGADIAPCHVDRHDGGPGRMLHDGMVDRKLGRLAERHRRRGGRR